MFPDRKTAIAEFEIVGEMNPGHWTEHSNNVAEAARLIAEVCMISADEPVLPPLGI